MSNLTSRIFPLLATQYYNVSVPNGATISYKIKKSANGVKAIAFYNNKIVGVFPREEAIRLTEMAFFGKQYDAVVVKNEEACRVSDRPQIVLIPKPRKIGLPGFLSLFSVLSF